MAKGTCSVEGCDKPVTSRGWCEMHYYRWRRHGDPAIVTPLIGVSGPDSPKWKGRNISYGSAHRRVRKLRGSASGHACTVCGGQAQDWAYDHCDPDEIVGPADASSGAGMPYSPDPNRYQPMCKPCHRAFDKAHVKG